MDPLASSFHSQEWEIPRNNDILSFLWPSVRHTGYKTVNFGVNFECELSIFKFNAKMAPDRVKGGTTLDQSIVLSLVDTH